MPTEIITALIAGTVTLVTTMGTLHVSMRRDREKQRDDIKAELIKYHEKNREEIQGIRDKDLREIRDDVSNMGANLQNKIALLELSLNHAREDITALSNRVEKHNQVVERVYHCEDTDKLLDEKIKVANARILDLEHKVG
jgi:peptidoglycan hydrolase CwlO-like protein